MIFKGLSIHIAKFHSQVGLEGGLIHETKIPVQELWMQMEGGILVGHYGKQTIDTDSSVDSVPYT